MAGACRAFTAVPVEANEAQGPELVLRKHTSVVPVQVKPVAATLAVQEIWYTVPSDKRAFEGLACGRMSTVGLATPLLAIIASATQVQLSGRGLVTGVQAQPGDTRLASTPVNVIAAVFPCLSVTPAKLMRARPATPRFVRRFFF